MFIHLAIRPHRNSTHLLPSKKTRSVFEDGTVRQTDVRERNMRGKRLDWHCPGAFLVEPECADTRWSQRGVKTRSDPSRALSHQFASRAWTQSVSQASQFKTVKRRMAQNGIIKLAAQNGSTKCRRDLFSRNYLKGTDENPFVETIISDVRANVCNMKPSRNSQRSRDLYYNNEYAVRMSRQRTREFVSTDADDDNFLTQCILSYQYQEGNAYGILYINNRSL